MTESPVVCNPPNKELMEQFQKMEDPDDERINIGPWAEDLGHQAYSHQQPTNELTVNESEACLDDTLFAENTTEGPVVNESEACLDDTLFAENTTEGPVVNESEACLDETLFAENTTEGPVVNESEACLDDTLFAENTTEGPVVNESEACLDETPLAVNAVTTSTSVKPKSRRKSQSFVAYPGEPQKQATLRARKSEEVKRLKQKIRDPKMRGMLVKAVYHHVKQNDPEAAIHLNDVEDEKPHRSSLVENRRAIVSKIKEAQKAKFKRDDERHADLIEELRGWGSIQAIASVTDLDYQVVKRALTKRKGPGPKQLSEEDRQFVKDHARLAGIIQAMPGKKQAGKVYLTCPYEEGYANFVESVHRINKDLPEDEKMRVWSQPAWYKAMKERKVKSGNDRDPIVRPMSKTPVLECLCQRCENCKLLFKKLHSRGNLGIPDHFKATFVAKMICPFYVDEEVLTAAKGDGDLTEEEKEQLVKTQGKILIRPETVESILPKLTKSQLVKSASMACLMRMCPECENKTAKKWSQMHLQLTKEMQLNEKTGVLQWDRAKVTIKEDENEWTEVDKKGKEYVVKEQVATIKKDDLKKSTFVYTNEEIITKWYESFHDLCIHLTTRYWQEQQHQQKLSSLKEGEVVWVIDFMQNLSLQSPDEVQGGHFCQAQISFFVAVGHFRCPEEGCGAVASLEVNCFFAMKEKTANIVDVMVRKAFNQMKDRVKMTEAHIWSDNCASQFKNRFWMFYLTTYRVSTTMNFWAEHHGKGTADAAGSRAKQDLSGILKNGPKEGIQHGQDLVKALIHYNATRGERKKMMEQPGTRRVNTAGCCRHIDRRYIFVTTKELEENPKPKDHLVPRIPGISKMHFARNQVGTSKIELRELTCYCR